MNSLFGIRIFENPLLVKTVVTYQVQRSPIKKRRRNWRVVRIEKQEPAIFMLAGGMMAVHPALMAKMRQALHEQSQQFVVGHL